MPKFFKKIINIFYGFQTSEKYMSNYSQILQKIKKRNTKSTSGQACGVVCMRCRCLGLISFAVRFAGGISGGQQGPPRAEALCKSGGRARAPQPIKGQESA